MRVEITQAAKSDLRSGARFYDKRERGLGNYFLRTLREEIRSLAKDASIYPKIWNDYQRFVSATFPFAVVYRIEDEVVVIHVVFDCRRNPERLRKRLR